jgi:DNA polymerase-3 subunit epsilon
MKNTLYSVLDIESTGLSPKYDDRIIEIGVTKIDIDGNIIDTYETLVNPVRKVSATNIHGINDCMVKDAPRFRDIADELLLFLNETVFVAHNVGFDMSFLRWEFGQVGYDISDNPRLCTLTLSRKILPNLPSKKLEFLCNHFGIDSGLAHSAYSDAFATSKLFSILMNRYSYREKLEKPDLVDYMKKYRIQTAEAVHHIKRSDVINCR